jgi:hypothetical protein
MDGFKFPNRFVWRSRSRDKKFMYSVRAFRY